MKSWIAWVYVAGPFTEGNVNHNIRTAIEAGDILWHAGFFPYIPHLNYTSDLVSPKTYDTWMEIDEVEFLKCDYLLSLPGKSPVSDQEIRVAGENNIPVFNSLEELLCYK